MDKSISKSKLILALISLTITFFVWQQGLKESLNRPSVSFDISQKEKEIAELAMPAIPIKAKNFLITNDPIDEINITLSDIPFDELTERNKLIWIISKDFKEEIPTKYFGSFTNQNFQFASQEIKKTFLDNSYKPKAELFNSFREDRFIYHLLSKKFQFNDSELITNQLSERMFIKLVAIRSIPIISIIFGTILVLRSLWLLISKRKIEWKEYKSLDLNLLDMVLLISGGFVVLGEVVSPIFSITLVELFSTRLSNELVQSLKIFIGYLFMAIPPLFIIFYQIKYLEGNYSFKKDYFQFNYLPIKDSILQGIKGWLMVIPFVLMVSLLMNNFIDNQNGSNPLLEIVLNNNNYFSFILLFLTTTLLAPLFEEIVFRGVLLPILSRDFGIILGITISSFIFALAHLSISEMPPLFVLGIGLGITRLISGRLLSSVVMHSLWNGLTFLNLLLLRT